jgi:formylglycine-generating enzyme required for sulfatase activity
MKQTKYNPAVDRGGAWYVGAEYCRSAIRSLWLPGYRGNNLGFRIAKEIKHEAV